MLQREDEVATRANCLWFAVMPKISLTTYQLFEYTFLANWYPSKVSFCKEKFP